MNAYVIQTYYLKKYYKNNSDLIITLQNYLYLKLNILFKKLNLYYDLNLINNYLPNKYRLNNSKI